MTMLSATQKSPDQEEDASVRGYVRTIKYLFLCLVMLWVSFLSISIYGHSTLGGMDSNVAKVKDALERYSRAHGGLIPENASEATRVLTSLENGYLPDGRLPVSPWGGEPLALGQATEAMCEISTRSGYVYILKGKRVPHPKNIDEFGEIIYYNDYFRNKIVIFGVDRGGDRAYLFLED